MRLGPGSVSGAFLLKKISFCSEKVTFIIFLTKIIVLLCEYQNKFFEKLNESEYFLSLFQVWLPIMKMDKKKFKALMSAGANAGLNNRFHLVTTPATSEFSHISSIPDYIEDKKRGGIIRYNAFASAGNFTSSPVTCKFFKLSIDAQIRKIVIGTLVTTKSGAN